MKDILRLAIVFTVFGILLLGNPLIAQDSDSGFKIIVNKSNPVLSLTKSEVSNMFYKKVTKWENQADIIPVDLNKESPIRLEFSMKIHGKHISNVDGYWRQMIFSGRKVPPPEIPSESEVISIISKNPNAIGYVSENTPVENVKVVNVVY